LNSRLFDCKKNSLFRDKKFVERHPSEIKVGDIVQLMPGSTIPADGIVIKGKDLYVDEEFLNCPGGNKNMYKDSIDLRNFTLQKFNINNKEFLSGLKKQ